MRQCNNEAMRECMNESMNQWTGKPMVGVPFINEMASGTRLFPFT